MTEPIDKELYEDVKKMANTLFKSPTGIFRSLWIQREYKQRGGLYKTKKKSSKIQQWLDEKWIDINNPILKNNKIIGYNKCGSVNKQNMLYPLCRPTVKVSDDTPKLFKDIDKDVIKRVNKQKQTLRNKGNIRF